MKKILFAHQSSVPQYRIPFYNTLKNNKPDWWDFEVLIPKDDDINEEHVFELVRVNEIKFVLANKTVRYQAFLSDLDKYDLLIVEDSVNNLSYPLSHYLKGENTKICYWGHGRDTAMTENSSFLKKWIEKFRIYRIKKSDGFFAYTDGVKEFLIKRGVDKKTIYSVNNTIDILKERELWQKYKSQTKDEGKYKLLMVGRLNKAKKIEYLVEVFKYLKKFDHRFELTIVGDGNINCKKILIDNSEKYNINLLGKITKSEALAKIFVDHNIFLFPGYVGLGPLHSMCYNLIPVIREMKNHGPEVEYLNNKNALILPSNVTPVQYANHIYRLVDNEHKMQYLKNNIWPSISELTIENMANVFISGINSTFNRRGVV